MSWQLTYNGTTQSLAQWGIKGLVRELRSQDTGTLRFTLPGTLTTPPFTYRAAVSLARDGVIVFRGVVTRQSAAGSGSEELVAVEVSDPWWFLENLVYEQSFKVFAGWVDSIPGGTPILNDDSTSHILLNKDIDGTIWGTRDQLEDALDWAIAQGAPITYTAGTFPDMRIPLREEKDVTCAEVIRRQLAYMDAVTWWDFSVNPARLNIARRSSLAVATVPVTSCKSVAIVPRNELQVPFVKIKFEKAYQDTGGSFMQIVEQVYPDPEPAEKFGALLATVILAPSQSVSAQQALEVATLDATSVAFWQAVKSEMTDSYLYADLAVVGGTASVTDMNGNPVTLPNYVVDGQIADWMDVDYAAVNVEAEVSYKVKEDLGGTAVTLGDTRRKRVSVRLVATNAVTDLYSTSTVVDAGESASEFAGLAQNIYTDLNALNHDGSFVIVERECSGSVGLGNRVNLTGGPSWWASLAAPVQAITEDLDAGLTEVQIGINKRLSAGSLVELLRVNRTRQYARFTSRDSGSYGRANDITLPGTGKEQNTTEAESVQQVASVSKRDILDRTPAVKIEAEVSPNLLPVISLLRYTSAGAEDSSAGKISIELGRTGGRSMRIYEAKVCLPDGSEKYCRILASETYTNPEIGGEIPIGSDTVTP